MLKIQYFFIVHCFYFFCAFICFVCSILICLYFLGHIIAWIRYFYQVLSFLIFIKVFSHLSFFIKLITILLILFYFFYDTFFFFFIYLGYGLFKIIFHLLFLNIIHLFSYFFFKIYGFFCCLYCV